MAVTSHSISLEKKLSHKNSLQSSLSTTYLFFPFTSNSVNEKLGGKYRRMYWLAVSIKYSSMSALLAAKIEK